MAKSTFLRILKKLSSHGLQLLVVLAIVVTGVVAFNLGARHGGHDGHGAPTSPPATPAAEPAETIYTCSMHPQIRQNEPGNCPICGMELVPVEQVPDAAPEPEEDDHSAAPSEPAGFACAMNCLPPLEEPGACPICGMEMQPVFDEPDHAAHTGGDPARRVTFSPEAIALASIQTARVERKVPVREVRMVGTVEEDTSTRVYISADVGGRIDALYADYPGVTVERGQDLVLLYSPELLAVQHEFLQAVRSFRSTEAELPASLRRANAMGVEAGRERLRLAGMTRGQIDELEQEMEAREQVLLMAPAGGTVLERNYEPGQYVNKGDTILTLSDFSRLWVDLRAYETDLPWLRKGQEIVYTTRSLPGEEFTGTITFVDPIADPGSRTIRVRAEVENRDGRLKPGMYVTSRAAGQIAGGQPQLIIPDTAALVTGRRAIVYIEVPGTEIPTFEGREVVLGPRTADGYVVTEGLSEGERVAVRGAFRIDSALQIRARPSMMSPEGGPPPGHDHGPAEVPADDPDEHETHAEKGPPASAGLIEAYIHVQTALANDDEDGARGAFRHLAHAAAEAGHDAIADAARKAVDAEGIGQMREAFEDASIALIEHVEKRGHAWKETLFLAHCPMTFDWKGSDWLQAEEEIYNPYFGDEMLHCGQIMKEFEPK